MHGPSLPDEFRRTCCCLGVAMKREQQKDGRGEKERKRSWKVEAREIVRRWAGSLLLLIVQCIRTQHPSPLKKKYPQQAKYQPHRAVDVRYLPSVAALVLSYI